MGHTFREDQAQARTKAKVPPADTGEWMRTRLGFEADEAQMAVVRSEAKRGILNCTRQWGKSTVGAAKAVHRAFTRAESLVLVASPSERQSNELVRKAKGILRKLGILPRRPMSKSAAFSITTGNCCRRCSSWVSCGAQYSGDFSARLAMKCSRIYPG